MNLRAPLLLVLAVASVACGSSATTSTTITSPASSRCDANVSSSSNTFGPGGGTGTLSISVPRECSWRATTPASWITFTTSADGQGDGTVGYRVAANDDPVTRQATVSIAERLISFSQQGAPCQYSVGGAPAIIGQSGGQATIDVRTHAACSWTARSETAWSTVSPTSGNGNATLNVTVAANSGGERPVSLTIAGQRVTMTQSALPAPAPAPAPAPTPAPPPAPPAPTPPPPGPTPPPPVPSPIMEISLAGRVANLSGGCPNWRFTIDSLRAWTWEKTSYERGPCSRMREGIEVELRGWLMSDGTLRVDQIRFDNDDGN